ncbi:MAG: hypothetical protein WCK86_05815 [Planctomycetia bacterium]
MSILSESEERGLGLLGKALRRNGGFVGRRAKTAIRRMWPYLNQPAWGNPRCFLEL